MVVVNLLPDGAGGRNRALPHELIKRDRRRQGRTLAERIALYRTAVLSRGRGLFARLGPGLFTGASDDDPSGIATYSQAGAQFGYAMGWVA